MTTTFLRVLALTAGLGWFGAAAAACPSHERIAAIARAWEEKEQLRGLPAALSMKDAECGRKRLVEALQLTQGRIVGYKAGLTNRAIQDQVGIASPVRGVLMEKMLLPDGAEVPANFGARPVFEPDLLVEVKDAAIHKAKTHLDVLKSLSRVIPFIELPDLMLAESEKMTGPIAVLINVGARLGVVGKGVRVEATEPFAAALAAMRVVAADQNGKELASGKGAAILDHPLNAVLWLVEDLGKSGVRLKPGDVLSLGAFTPPLPPKAGLAVTVRYEGLPGNPSVSVRFR
jgi:2-keto-4-pentenoate hydratase